MAIFIVMGVSGSGKSTVGIALATQLVIPFLDADTYHPAANVAKMSKGIPLTDEDRWPWLDALVEAVKAAGPDAVLACSALKEAYRSRLRAGIGPLTIVYLQLSKEAALARVSQRKGHFMPSSLVESQFETLEPPLNDAIVLDATLPVAALVDAIIDRYRTSLLG